MLSNHKISFQLLSQILQLVMSLAKVDYVWIYILLGILPAFLADVKPDRGAINSHSYYIQVNNDYEKLG